MKQINKPEESIDIKMNPINTIISNIKLNSLNIYLLISNSSGQDKCLTQVILDYLNINFNKKITQEIDIQIVLDSLYLKYNNKFLISYLIDQSEKKKQTEIRIEVNRLKELKMSIEINHTEINLIIDGLMLLKSYFSNCLPKYDINGIDIPNKYDSNEDNIPSRSFHIKIINPKIILLSKINESICLSGDIKLIYKTEKKSDIFNQLTIKLKEKLNELSKLKDLIKYNENNILSCKFCLKNQDEIVSSLKLDYKKYNICEKCIENIKKDNKNNCSSFDTNCNKINEFSFCITCYNLIIYYSLCSLCTETKDKLLQINNKINILINYINNERHEISNLSIWLNNLNPYIVVDSKSKIRRLLTGMDFSMEIKETIKMEDENSFIIDKIIISDLSSTLIKISYKDLVILLKTINAFQEDILSKEYLNILNLIDIQSPSKQKNNNIESHNEAITNNYNIFSYKKNLFDFRLNIFSLKIMLIDNQKNSYFPFLYILLSELIITKEELTLNKSISSMKGFTEVMTFNSKAFLWEPIIEKVYIEISNIKTEKEELKSKFSSITKVFVPTKINNLNNSFNINISDISISILRVTLMSWIDKFKKFMNNFKSTIKEIDKDYNEIIQGNHIIINMTGNNIHINRNSKLSKIILPEEKYIISVDDETDNNLTNFHKGKNIINQVEFNYITFNVIDKLNDDEEHLINIDKTSSKIHNIKYNEIIKSNKSSIEIDSFKYIISHIKYENFNRKCYLYSPLIISLNSLIGHSEIKILFLRKNIEDKIICLNKNQLEVGVPFQYLDGYLGIFYSNKEQSERDNILKLILENRINNICLNDQYPEIRIFNMKDLLLNKLILNEQYIDKKYICFSIFEKDMQMNKLNSSNPIIEKNYKNNYEEKMNLKIFKITFPYKIVNALTSELTIDIKSNKNKNGFEKLIIPKNSSSFVDSVSLLDSLYGKIRFNGYKSLDFEILFNLSDLFDWYKNNNKITISEIIENMDNSKYDKLKLNKEYIKNYKLFNKSTSEIMTVSIIIGDISTGNRTLVIYCPRILVDFTGIKDLIFLTHKGSYKSTKEISSRKKTEINKKKYMNQVNYLKDIDSQFSEMNYINNESIDNIYFLTNNFKYLQVRLFNKFSNDFDFNAIDIPTELVVNGKEIICTLSLQVINQEFNIISSIIVLSPKYIICNDINKYSLFINDILIKNGERKPIYSLKDNILASDEINFYIPEVNDDYTFSKDNLVYTFNILNLKYKLTYDTIKIQDFMTKENIYIDIEKRLDSSTNILIIIFKESSLKSAKIIINNSYSLLNLKCYQYLRNKDVRRTTKEFLQSQILYVNQYEEKIFTWSQYKNNIDSIEYEIAFEISNYDIMSISNESNVFYINNTSIIINLSEFDKEFSKKMTTNQQRLHPFYISLRGGMCIKFEIIVDQLRRIITITKLQNQTYSRLSSFEKSDILDNDQKETIGEESYLIFCPYLGLSLITDNYIIFNSKMNYNRYEILFLLFDDIKISLDKTIILDKDKPKQKEKEKENLNNEICVNSKLNIKITSFEIDNQYNSITYFPIISHRIIDKDKSDNNSPIKPFFNFYLEKIDYIENSERNKFSLINFLIQGFYINIESELLDMLIFFFSNISEFSKGNLDQKLNDNQTIKLSIQAQISLLFNKSCFNSIIPPFLFSNYIKETNNRIFIDKLELSPIEINISLRTDNKSNIIKNYITKNSNLNIIITSVLNIDKTLIQLKGSEIICFHGTSQDLLSIILKHYHENALPLYFKLFFSIDILGNPVNLINDITIGVYQFFQKPADGIVKGPIGLIEGSLNGGMSLISHTIGGTFSMASKLTAGISKSMLNFTKDDTYIKKIEDNRKVNKPQNIVDGLTQGMESLTNGLTSGVRDVILKPVEDIKQKGIKGLFTGTVKGILGLVVKPVSGVFEFISQSTEGLKRSLQVEEVQIVKKRKQRVFYTKEKYFKNYNAEHSEYHNIIKSKIDVFKHYDFGFYDCIKYKNLKGIENLLLLCGEGLFLIDFASFNIKNYILYQNILTVKPDLENRKLIINFNKIISNKNCSSIYFFIDNNNELNNINKENNKIIEVYEKIIDAIQTNYNGNFLNI